MSGLVDTAPRSPFSVGPGSGTNSRNITMLSTSETSSESPHADPMDVTPPSSATMAPPVHSSPEMDHTGGGNTNGVGEGNTGKDTGSNIALGAAAAAAAQGPKVVQTAFIHKLYNMLEDQSIQHLISWSNTNESFVMSPSNEFSKVLAQYFKHTNISSFVRQLNMYGFHKVSDVFHTGSPESTLWEFKHGNGNFKKGDLVGLREIKRRASRHALIHRDSFSNQKPTASQPGTPAEPMPDTTDVRLMNLEHSLYDVHNRLARTEDSYALMSSRCQALTEGLVRCHQWNHSLSNYLLAMVPDQESPLYREVANMQKEISRQLELVRALENPHEALLSGRQPYFSNMSLDPAPLSPRQLPQDDARRSSILDAPRPTMIRPPVPPHLAISPRRYGSIGGPNPSPSYNRSPLPPQPPPPPHPLSSVTSPPGPNLARRHTSADIRQHGWPGAPTGGSPFASGNSSVQWPSSPNRTPNPGDQQVRDVLAQYEMGGPRRQQGSRQATPPPPTTSDTGPSALSAEGTWSFGGPRYARPPTDNISAPATRRSSMASNVHSLLNPAETAERADEDDPLTGDDRKRKRLQ